MGKDRFSPVEGMSCLLVGDSGVGISTPDACDLLNRQAETIEIFSKQAGEMWLSIKELPPTCSEDAIDGEWYLGVRKSVSSYEHPEEKDSFVNVGICRTETIIDRTCLQMAGTEIPVDQFETIYGPLKFHIPQTQDQNL